MVSQTNGRTLSVHQEHEFLKRVEAAGLDSRFVQKVIDSKNNVLAIKVVELIKNGGFQPTTSQKRGREIMEKNFFGIEEAIKYFGVNPSEEQVKTLSEIPFSEEVLQKTKDTHVLVAVFPLSILDIRGKTKHLFYNQDWYNQQDFAKEKGMVEWRLIKKTPVPNSTSKSWKEQQQLLEENEQVPSAQIMVYTIIGHYLAIKERLFENIYVRTFSLDSDGSRVSVGYFDSDGLDVNSCWAGDRSGLLALASSQKS